MKKIDYTDPMSMFHSRKTAKIVTQRELQAAKDRSEWSVQLEFCKWVKHTYPDILFRSDEQNAKKRTPMMQNIMDIIDPYREGFPDVTFYEPRGKYAGLFIELKREGSGLWLKDGSMSTQEHFKKQAAYHQKLRDRGYCVEFAEGVDEAKKVFLGYLDKV